MGEWLVTVDDDLAAAFAAGDRLIALADSGELLHVPASAAAAADEAVGAASVAFERLRGISDEQIDEFFGAFATRLGDSATVAALQSANAGDVERAEAAGRSTTRLLLSEKMLADMVAGLVGWQQSSLRRSAPVRTVDHDGWAVELSTAPLGVVAFVFEGRPNVFADAAGVVRTGNTVVMRIGGDALGTAEAMMERAVLPALRAAGLPEGTVSLVRSRERAAGHALFSDQRVALAVARGSGAAVAQLGAVARQAGVAVSLHGTGGAWLVAAEDADVERFAASVRHSLDRKVCNTLNVCCVPRSRPDLVAALLAAADEAAAARGTVALVHVDSAARGLVPAERFTTHAPVRRAEGLGEEPLARPIERSDLGIEWEWEDAPELTLVTVDSLAEAVELCNRHSPRFVASLIAESPAAHDEFFAAVDAPFVGDGFTRWVDGQYALDTPELGLANWQFGRLLARGAILSGDSVHTVRYRARVSDPDLHR